MRTARTAASPTPRVLGQILLARGDITAAALTAALEEQRTSRRRLGEILVAHGTDAEAIARGLAAQLRLGYVPPPVAPTPEALALVDGALAARLRIAPIDAEAGTLRIAMADPLDAGAIDDLRFRTGRRVEPAVASPATIGAALAAYHAGAVDAILRRLPEPAAGPPARAADVPDITALRRASEAPPVIALVELVLARAVRERASDIHVEPGPAALRVRARVDGVLRPLVDLPAHAVGAFVSRVKVMADLDIAVRRRPQDGRASVRVDGRELGLRISTLPAQDGEKLVIRLLDGGAAAPRLDALGMAPDTEARFRRLLGHGHGVILVTGPTGSGKTTTLYAALGTLDRDRRNVLSLEDPVEYRLPGCTQVQVHRRAGLGFAAGLRAALRQDPDVIMIGELRDRETVETAMAAALTGHLVLSTLHTNDAATAVTRLVEMGAPPYLIAGGLIGVLAQRLARRPCPHCARATALEPADLARLGLPPGRTVVREAVGCARCNGTGGHGRTGIFEILVVDATIRTRILRRAPAHAIRDAARAAGMTTLAQDAWARVRTGATTPEEVRPLLALLGEARTLCPACGGDVRPGFDACPCCGHLLRERCACGRALDRAWRHCPRCAVALGREDGQGEEPVRPRRVRTL
jgi:type IV pilus assembly protein PilB